MMKTDFNANITITFGRRRMLIKSLKIGSEQDKSHFISEFWKIQEHKPGLNRHSRSNYSHFDVRVSNNDENMTHFKTKSLQNGLFYWRFGHSSLIEPSQEKYPGD